MASGARRDQFASKGASCKAPKATPCYVAVYIDAVRIWDGTMSNNVHHVTAASTSILSR